MTSAVRIAAIAALSGMMPLITCHSQTRPAQEKKVISPQVRIEPSVVTVRQGDTQQFRVIVEGLEDAKVVWNVRNGAGGPSLGGGTVSKGGVYTPGSTRGKWFYIHATSTIDPAVSDVARVEVISADAPMPSQRVKVKWRSKPMQGWAMRYEVGLEKDAERIAALVDRSLAELKIAFADRQADRLLAPVELHVDVHPRKDQGVGIGTMNIQTGNDHARLSLLTPSAHGPSGKDGWPEGYYGELYFHKNIVHELSTIFLEQMTYQKKAGGWTFHEAPRWFVQGIEEYLGCTIAGDEKRLARYVAAVAGDASRVSAEFRVREVYGDGCAVVAFLFDAYGKKRVLDVLASPAKDFWTATRDVLGAGRSDLHQQLSKWRAGRDHEK